MSVNEKKQKDGKNTSYGLSKDDLRNFAILVCIFMIILILYNVLQIVEGFTGYDHHNCTWKKCEFYNDEQGNYPLFVVPNISIGGEQK